MPQDIDFKNLCMKFDDSQSNCYYIGQWNDDANKGEERQGFGILIIEDGDIYEGFWDEGQYKYFGRLIQPTGKIYQGQFKFSQPNGAGVTIKTKFEKSGKRRTEYRHKGYYQNGRYHGNGTLDYTNHFKYVGLFQRGKMTSLKSKIEYSNGAVYTGETFEGKKQGNGVLVYQNGSKYEGTFINDQPDGQGKETQMNSNGEIEEKYVGGFKQGKRHSKGQIFVPSKKKGVSVVYDQGYLVSDK